MIEHRGHGQDGSPVYRNGDAYVARAFVCVEEGYYEHRYGVFLTSNGRGPYDRVDCSGSLPDAIESCNKYAGLRWVNEPSCWKRLFRAGRWEVM